MSHCRSPQACSVCLGAVARRVEVVNGMVTVDGESTGRVSGVNGMSEQMRASSKRGGAKTRQARSRR